MIGARHLAFFAVASVVGCSARGESVDSSEGAILPNGSISETALDSATYAAIADYFAAAGKDLHVDLTKFTPDWPLDDPKEVVLNRFGTPIRFGEFAYVSTGVDVLRSSTTVSIGVRAPVDGVAAAFDWSGKPAHGTTPYATLVGIYDPASHAIVVLAHVGTTSTIGGATAPVAVTKGSLIGNLAPAPLSGSDADTYSLTRVVVVDGANKQLVNPIGYFANYADAVAPTLKGLYVTDSDGDTNNWLVTDKLDLVLNAYDRDGASNRNLELSAIAYTATDNKGNVVASVARCALDDLYSSVDPSSSFHVRDLIDFGTGSSQMTGSWPFSDVGNANRTFRYALNHLAVQNGKCTLLSGQGAAVDVTASIKSLKVAVTAWDAKGTKTDKTFTLDR